MIAEWCCGAKIGGVYLFLQVIDEIMDDDTINITIEDEDKLLADEVIDSSRVLLLWILIFIIYIVP